MLGVRSSRYRTIVDQGQLQRVLGNLRARDVVELERMLQLRFNKDHLQMREIEDNSNR